MSEFQIGDVVELQFENQSFLGEILAVNKNPGIKWGFLCLVPTNFSRGGRYTRFQLSSLFSNYTFPNYIPSYKLLQHKMFPIALSEITRKTDYRW